MGMLNPYYWVYDHPPTTSNYMETITHCVVHSSNSITLSIIPWVAPTRESRGWGQLVFVPTTEEALTFGAYHASQGHIKATNDNVIIAVEPEAINLAWLAIAWGSIISLAWHPKNTPFCLVSFSHCRANTNVLEDRLLLTVLSQSSCDICGKKASSWQVLEMRMCIGEHMVLVQDRFFIAQATVFSVFLLALPKTSPEIISPAHRIRSRLLGCTACISWTS